MQCITIHKPMYTVRVNAVRYYAEIYSHLKLSIMCCPKTLEYARSNINKIR
jgi:hypothetical protein